VAAARPLARAKDARRPVVSVVLDTSVSATSRSEGAGSARHDDSGEASKSDKERRSGSVVTRVLGMRDSM
jgi:hypothetical protein